MLTLRDHQSGDLFDPWEYLGPQRRRLLEQGWAGVFRDYLLKHLPVKELAVSFQDDFGRPSKDLYVALGALILQQLHDLTDQQTTEAVALNIAWHYALDIRHEPDAYLCERTLRNYRCKILALGLDEILFRTLTDQLIVAVGVDTSKQRLNSTAVRSAIRGLTRLGILVETLSKFLRELKRTIPEQYAAAKSEARATTAGRQRRVSRSLPQAGRHRGNYVAFQAPDGHGSAASSRHSEGDLHGAATRAGAQHSSRGRISNGSQDSLCKLERLVGFQAASSRSYATIAASQFIHRNSPARKT